MKTLLSRSALAATVIVVCSALSAHAAEMTIAGAPIPPTVMPAYSYAPNANNSACNYFVGGKATTSGDNRFMGRLQLWGASGTAAGPTNSTWIFKYNSSDAYSSGQNTDQSIDNTWKLVNKASGNYYWQVRMYDEVNGTNATPVPASWSDPYGPYTTN